MIKRALALALVAVVLSPAAAGAAYRDTHFDPNDVGSRPDVRSTTRSVSQAHGRRVLVVLVRTYGSWPGPQIGFHVKVPLDTQGGRRADAQLEMVCCQDVACVVQRHHSRLGVGFRVHGDRAVCRAPTRLLEPTKRIRWKVIATDGSYHHPDSAPNDRSWYA